MNTQGVERDVSRDTLSKEVFIYTVDDTENRQLFSDSTLHNFHRYDPTRQSEYEYFHLGNLGSAHRAIVYQPRFQRGFDAGFHHYDLYLTHPEDIAYYDLEKAYSDIYFSQSNQERTSFSANFSKPVLQQFFIGLRYRNINNEGQYANQNARTNALTGTVQYSSKNGQYRSYLSYTSNTIQQRENGGGIPDSLTFRKGILPVGRPVNLLTAQARHFGSDLNLTHYYFLQKKPPPAPTNPALDSLQRAVLRPDSSAQNKIELPPVAKSDAKNTQRPRFTVPSPTPASSNVAESEGRKFTVKHNFSLRRNTYKYFDETTNTLDFYEGFITDDRGIRTFTETRQIANTVGLQTFRLERDERTTLFGTEKSKRSTQKDLLEVGAAHTFTRINQEPLDSSLHNLFLYGKLQYTPSKRLNIKAYGHLGTLRQIGDYFLQADLLWDTKKLGALRLGLQQQLRTPGLFQRQFVVTQTPVWQNDFRKVFENSLSASYALPKLGLELTAYYHLIDNYIYYDTDARPTQLAGGLNILQLIARHRLDLGRFHFRNAVYIQQATSDVLRFPNVYSIHQAYVDLRLFRNWLLEVGFDARLNTPFFADRFQPLTGQFYLQNEVETDFYPMVDAFINFRLSQFRFFLVVENLYDYGTTDFFFPVYPYAAPDSNVRFGFRWLFLD